MQPELRLIEDFMTDKGAITLPAQPRMLYVVRGAIMLGRRAIRAGASGASSPTPRRPARVVAEPVRRTTYP